MDDTLSSAIKLDAKNSLLYKANVKRSFPEFQMSIMSLIDDINNLQDERNGEKDIAQSKIQNII